MAECRLHPGTPTGSCCCRFPSRLQPGARPPPKKIVRQYSLSVSGSMENRNTSGTRLHLQQPCPNTSECGCLPGSAGTRWLQQALPNVLPAVEPLFPVWPKNLPDPTLFLGIHLSHPGTSRYRAACGLAEFVLPLFTVLIEFKPSPFSFLPF